MLLMSRRRAMMAPRGRPLAALSSTPTWLWKALELLLVVLGCCQAALM